MKKKNPDETFPEPLFGLVIPEGMDEKEYLEKLVEQRNETLLKMGYLPPDENHQYWWNPKEE